MTFNPSLVGTSDLKNQKKRGIKPTQWPKINFGDGAFILLNEGRLEYYHLTLLKKIFKNFEYKLHQYMFPVRREVSIGRIRRRGVKVSDLGLKITGLKKCFLFHLHINCPITKKSKNSRMGKGKGLLVKWVLRNKRLFKLVEFRFVSLHKIKIIFLKIVKKYPFKLKLLIKKDVFKNDVFSLNRKLTWTDRKKTYINYINDINII